MPWREASVMDQRIAFVSEVLRDRGNMAGICREFGISRATGYKWVGRYFEAGSFTGLHDKSRRPHSTPNKTSRELEDAVIELRLYCGWGGRKLQVLLRKQGIELPVITIDRIIKRNGLIRKKDNHGHATKRFERARPNELWQMDFKGEYRLRRGGLCYPLSIIDDHSRYAVGLDCFGSPNGHNVHGSLIRTFEKYGVPDAMLMDHGTPWWSTTNAYGLTWVSVFIIKQGVRIYQSGIRHPQTQGKVERFHRTLKESAMFRGVPESLDGWEKFLRSFRREYNHERPHEALGMDVPSSRYERSDREYRANPAEWEYPEGSDVMRLNTQGCLDYAGRRYFACEALKGERVRIDRVDNRILVSYRQMYIREINLATGKTNALVLPVGASKCVNDVMI